MKQDSSPNSNQILRWIRTQNKVKRNICPDFLENNVRVIVFLQLFPKQWFTFHKLFLSKTVGSTLFDLDWLIEVDSRLFFRNQLSWPHAVFPELADYLIFLYGTKFKDTSFKELKKEV